MNVDELMQHCTCPQHSDHRVTSFCRDCNEVMCVVCTAIRHEGHTVLGLTDLMVELQGDIKAVISKDRQTRVEVDDLITSVPATCQQLHDYIDRELNCVEETLEEKRAALHQEVEDRTNEAKRQLLKELAWVGKELNTLQTGAHVLEALSKRDGIVEGRLGGLITEKISFDEFMAEVDAPLHEPPRMLEMLALQLPTQSLQEMCDLITWTNISQEPTAQIFPSS